MVACLLCAFRPPLSGEGHCPLALGAFYWLGHDDEAMSVSTLRALFQLDDVLGLGRLGFVSMHGDFGQAVGGGVCPAAQAVCHGNEPSRHIPYRQVELRQHFVPSGPASGRS